jgi:hypothetical protein
MPKRKACGTGDNVGEGNMQPGSRMWFREKEGLNDDDYIPQVDLPEEIISKEKFIAAWGKKNVYEFRNQHFMSNRQSRRVRYLY